MKSMICLLAILLVLIAMPSGNIVSLDQPYDEDGPGAGDNDPGGDDHPWGGNGTPEDNDDNPRVYTFTSTGMGAIDFVLNNPFFGNYVQSWIFNGSFSLIDNSRVEDKKEQKPSQPTGSNQKSNGDF